MSLVPGHRFDHYEILAPLGAGGMGEVYRARDTQLDREVAIKVLPGTFAQAPDRLRRFAQEAKTASALNHPNILTIYEIGAQNGTHFITTEFIAGQTLRERLRQPLTQTEALEIAVQIANALAAAHNANIIHRDIKPENVMLRNDGIVKVLDFGLAKLTERRSNGAQARLGEDDPTLALPAAASHTTEAGTVMGTASYMSPEQARGEKVDARSDLFSLGIVLYEMLAGRQPFAGANMLDVIGAILHRDFAPLPDEMPAELQRIVTKALQKERDARYQTAQDFARDLQEWKAELAYQARAARTEGLGAQASCLRSERSEATASVGSVSTENQATSSAAKRASVPSLAASETLAHPGAARATKRTVWLAVAALLVVAVAALFYFKRQPALTDKDTILLADFTNTTNDPVFDGTLKQALAVHLGQSPFLNLFADERVRETLRLMNKSPDERITPTVGREICQRQGLKAMLTGTIASLGRNYVISLEAVNGQTGDVLAREQGEAEGKEQVLRTLGEAATRLREKLGESLSSIQKYDVPLQQATTSSLDAFKAFVQGYDLNAKGKYPEAIATLKHAIELDPNLARAYASLGTTYDNSGQTKLGAEASQKAFELRDRVSERERFYIDSNYYRYVTGETYKAIEVLELHKQTYPNDPIYSNLATRYNRIGLHEKAVEELREGIRRAPNSLFPRTNLITSSRRLNRFDEAKAACEEVIARKMDHVDLRQELYYLANIRGDNATMQQQIDWVSTKPGEYVHLTWQAGTAILSGQRQKAQGLLNHAAELAKQRSFQEQAGEIISLNAEFAAVLGLSQQSRAELARAANLPRTPLSYFRAGIGLALGGQSTQLQTLIDAAVKNYPKHTELNEIYLPLIRAALELQRGNRAQAIQILEPARRYENVSFFYQNYLRGQAYLGERNGAAAAREFQTILDHRGWSPTSPVYPLAHLGLARAAVLQNEAAKAKQKYDEFFRLWKDADADLPVLMEAKKEYEKLKLP